MDKFSYQSIPCLDKDEVEAAIARDIAEEVSIAILSAVLHVNDCHWAEAICISLSQHQHFNVRGNAILGFGHLARLHGKLSNQVAKELIENALVDDNDFVRGQANSAADDVEHFLGWKIRRPN
jgi:hypothetical protein